MKASMAVAWAVIVCGGCPAGAGAQDPAPAGSAFSAQRPRVPQPAARPAAARRDPGRPGSVEFSGGVYWLAPGSLGSGSANLTPNSGSTPFKLFEASARMAGAPGYEVRATYDLSRRFAVEGGLLYSHPAIDLTIANDSESAAGFTAKGEALSQYFVDGNLLVFLPRLAFARGRGRTFVEGGAGYLRQLHEGRFNVETGTVYNGGAGIKYYFTTRPKGFLKAFGVRVDLRAYYKRRGFSFDGRNTWTAALGAGAIAAF